MRESAGARWPAALDAAAVALAAGGLLLAFPPFGLWPLAWIAPAPLLARAAPGAPGRAFTLGIAWGGLFFLGVAYWTHGVMVRYGGIPGWVALGLLLLLVLYLSLYFGVFLWGVCTGVRRWGSRALWLAPALFTALELLRGHALSGLPWALLGTSQVGFLPALAPAAWIGAYGVGSLIVLTWVWLARLGGSGLGARRRARLAGAGAAVLAFLFMAGAQRVRRLEALPADLRVACLQVNVPQAIKWSPAARGEVLERHRAMSLEAAGQGARLLAWPESSLPFAPGETVPEGEAAVSIEDWVARRALETGTDILWGGTAAASGPEGGVLNSAFLTRADGSTPSRYDKLHLVPFGEYVPLPRLLTFVGPLVREVGRFQAGTRSVLHRTAGVTLGSVICYEILFPGLVRRAAAGAEVLVNLTNDAWFGTSVAPHIHLAAVPLRAVENGVAVVRAANTGISALVLPSGRVLASAPLEERRVLVGDVPGHGAGTFYRRHGDVWAMACAIIAAAYIAALFFPRAAHPRPGEPQA